MAGNQISAGSMRRRGGVRVIAPSRICYYCGRRLDRWCKARRVYRWGPVAVELVRIVCRSNGCGEQAQRDGYL